MKISGMLGVSVRGVCLGIALSLAGCAGRPVPRVPPSGVDPAVPRAMNLRDLCERFGAGWHWDSVSQVITVTNRDRVIEALVGSDVVIADQQKLILSSPIVARDSQIIVPPDFVKLLATPVEKSEERSRRRPSQNRLKTARKVMIDPGHGGKDPGALARTGAMHEKAVVLDICRRVRELLQRERVQVELTRDTDEFVALKDRAEMASKAGADLFVSIHANSHPKAAVLGLEVYTLRDLSPYEMKEQQRQESLRLYFRGLKMEQGRPHLETMIEDLLYHYKQTQSLALAKAMGAQTARLVKTRDMGVKESRFYVLRNTVVPAVLIEVGFLSNPREERQLGTAAYRQKLAEGIARGILSYIHD